MHDVVSADAPGRVNLIGEHTDYHDGYVLPTVIPQRTRVELRPRADRRVRAASPALGERWEEYEAGAETPGRGWLDYVQGVTATLAARGVDVPGFDARISSDVPIGAGVSSSAALEVSLLRALRTLLSLDLDDVEIAQIAQAAETDFVGAPVGIMDQMASSLGRDREALFLDTRTLAVERLPLPASMEVVVIDSGITHAHAGGEYVTRRRESFEAAALLRVERLRDAGPTLLPRLDDLPPVLARRARHIITENERVLAAVAAIRAADPRRLGELFAASHASMRDDYETSTPEIDMLVAIAAAHPEVYGARLTGGGFGGAVVALVRRGTAPAAAEEIRQAYVRRTGRRGAVLVPAFAVDANAARPGTLFGR
jgi:galactokinase